ncbi:MAG: hypothetical protein NWE98_06060 [Candidatus Bathyarchaeota archaeon]|nr:hypothetical protein [Candidatus Bathyarchaeota archaeon]
MGCFSNGVVYLCPDRIRACPENLIKIASSKSWLSNPEKYPHNTSSKVIHTEWDVKSVYRFVFIHEHAHAITVPSKPEVDAIDSKTKAIMNEGIAQWISFKKICKPRKNRTITLFKNHANSVPEEYRFYEKLATQEKKQGLASVINTVSCWRNAPENYNWQTFVLKANKDIFELDIKC